MEVQRDGFSIYAGSSCSSRGSPVSYFPTVAQDTSRKYTECFSQSSAWLESSPEGEESSQAGKGHITAQGSV